MVGATAGRAGNGMLRIGCVKYLNARPLTHGWEGDVDFDHPSTLCSKLSAGKLDVALVSSFEFLRNPIYRIVDDVSISSDGPVYSVVVAHRGEIADIEEIELDPASETSASLLRCLLPELGLNPRFVERSTGILPVALAGVSPAVSKSVRRAKLLIGDQAIRFRKEYADEFSFWDLDDLIAEAVAGVADPGLRRGLDREFFLRYYSDHLRFGLSEKEKEGLRSFANLCIQHGLLPKRDFVLRVV